MTDRERFLDTLLFGRPDRIPFEPGGPRESTLAAWRDQGLPAGANWLAWVRDRVGIEPPPSGGRPGVWMRHTMIPEFEERVVEERGDTRVVQDWKGNICEMSSRFDVSYLRWAKDFVTRRWLRCPVETRADWDRMRERYDAEDPARLPADLPALGRLLASRDYPVGLNVHGPFWQMREWLGFEGLCVRFLDDPDLIADMALFWTGYVARLLERLLAHAPIDFLHVSEDMAYKVKPMISPTMARRYLLPCYATWRDVLRAHGCPLYMMDSDGFVGDLIPVWIEGGFNVCDPMEVAAGNDLPALRSAFGRRMAFRGGVDKREMARGGGAIRAEMARLGPVARDGGYIPGCDHGVPANVSLDCFVEYCELLARMTGWT
ncbi:MAG: hypothetical protein IT208_16725 [Chthonomonadales bacterium]|nr:hypothetical protein [Chthonomonadales bacterium]